MIDKVAELKTALGGLDGKDIAINIIGDANEQLDAIATKIAALDGRTITIGVIYKNLNSPDAAAAAQTVQRVFVGSDNAPPVIQPVIDKVINSTQTGALRDQINEVINATTPNSAAAVSTQDALAAAIQGVTEKMASENLTAEQSANILSKLKYASQDFTNTNVQEENGSADLEKALSSVANARAFVAAATDKQTQSTLLSLDATIRLAQTDQLLNDAQAVIVGDMSKSDDIFGATTRTITGQAAQVGILAGWWSQWGTVVHWVVAGFAEWAAVAIPGMVAMGSAMLVAAQAAGNVYDRLTAMFTVQEALGPVTGQTIGTMQGLGSSFQKAQDAMQPELYEIYGAAINALKGKGDQLAQMGIEITNVFDTFAAKVDVELKGAFGDELTGLISKGAQDFTEFGQILGNIGHAIANFAAAMPGLAEVLLKIIDVLSDFLKIISEIPAPIITAAMAFEEFLRWGSLVNGMVAGLIGVFSKFAGVLGADCGCRVR